MAGLVLRGSLDGATLRREPDLFLSYSSGDKDFVRKLALDLNCCEIDPWLDEWELAVGDSLMELIGQALRKSRFVGIVLSPTFFQTTWTKSEIKEAFAREQREGRTVLLPLLRSKGEIPPFLEDRKFIDFRGDEYYSGLARLAAYLHGISTFRVDGALQAMQPWSLNGVIKVLRSLGKEPYVIVGDDDFRELSNIGDQVSGNRVRFDPELVFTSKQVSMHVKDLIMRVAMNAWCEELVGIVKPSGYDPFCR
jgi:hypothetical protein